MILNRIGIPLGYGQTVDHFAALGVFHNKMHDLALAEIREEPIHEESRSEGVLDGGCRRLVTL